MKTKVEEHLYKGKKMGYTLETTLTTAKEMYLYEQNTYTHTEYYTKIENFIFDNELDSFYSRLSPTLKENGEVIYMISITNIDNEKLEREFLKFKEYFNTFLTLN